MKVLLLYPNINCQVGINHGLMSLAALLKQHGHGVHLVNLNERVAPLPDQAQFRAIIDEQDPGLVGFGVLTNQWPYTQELAGWIKAYRPELPTVAGGTHATMTPGEVIAHPHIDYVCVGEGEFALLELVKKLEEGGDTTNIANIWAKTPDGKVHPNNVAGFYPNLEELPMPDYDVFDFQHTLDVMNGWCQVMATRGCPYRCTYCFNHKITDRYKTEAKVMPKDYLRTYPVKKIIDLMVDLRRKYNGIKTFIFDDDLFTWFHEYVLEFAEAYRGAGLDDIPYVVNGHPKVFDEQIAHALAESNCYIVKFGLESGSDRIRNILKRHMTNKDIIKSFDAAEKFGIHTSAFVMFGLPTETPQDMWDSFELMARIKPGRYRWSVFFPFPGTKSYDDAEPFIDWEKYYHLDNYFDGSCMRFDIPGMDLFVDKAQKCFHWFVGSLTTDWKSHEVYQDKVRDILSLNEDRWAERKDKLLDEDRGTS